MTTTATQTCSSPTWKRRQALSQRTKRPFRGRHARDWASTARSRLRLLGVGLRQRRLARYLRRLVTIATSPSIVNGMIGEPHNLTYRTVVPQPHGERFENVTQQAGLDAVYSPMGCNFADFDNDGWLDFYLGTGEPEPRHAGPESHVQERGWRTRFADITGSSGTGHLQKGHGVACGDWDRDGDVDLFIEMGGAVNGDKYHNVLFQNPGQGNHWLTVKLIGRKTNRAAIGARIKVVTAGAATPVDLRLRFFRQQLRRQPLATDDRPGRRHERGNAGNPLAGQPHDPGFPWRRRGPGHRDHRVRRPFSPHSAGPPFPSHSDTAWWVSLILRRARHARRTPTASRNATGI